MKFKKANGKFYVNGEEFPTFEKAWAEIKKALGSEDTNITTKESEDTE